jgi:ABC-type Zn uptake system ZnuABC Zn-binding protein ZnuA
MLCKLGVLFMIVTAGLTACNGAAPAPTAVPDSTARLKVVATYSVLADLVRNVGGNQIELRTLVGPGADTHTFEPSPADGVAVSEAALLFENGLGFEVWLDDLYLSSDSSAKRVMVSEGIEPLEAPEGGHHDEEEQESTETPHAEGTQAGHEHEHGEFDPHLWHSVTNAIQMVKNIRAALANADPANAALYQSNADAYIVELQALDAWVFEQVKSVPEARRKLVTTHDTSGYFAARYGFEILGTVLPTSTEGASLSAQELAALVEAVRAAGVPAVFAENVSSNALLKQVATEAGVKVVAALYTDALGEPGSEGDTYLKMMRFNVTTIVGALK